MKIKHAEFKRIMERSDTLCADVEVQVEGDNRSLVVIFTESPDQIFDMTMILRKEAELDVDWYDNDLHSAYEDVTESLFQHKTGDREALKEAVLNYGNVREQIGKHLKEAKTVKA
ncbi:MAG: hypothetical protein K0S39_2001 [Paenibacillus sp.]|jgi:hypothetical protein|nr:hypothetical protein [Paenibacillus sp.]